MKQQQSGSSTNQDSSCISGTDSLHGSENSMELEMDMEMDMSPDPVSETLASCIDTEDSLRHFDNDDGSNSMSMC